jgi:hypothetical protein
MKIIRNKIILPVIIVILLIGTAIPKLTVHDAVMLTDEEKQCAEMGVRRHFDNPLQRIALYLGKSAVVDKQGDGINKKNTLTVKSYTIFRIPLPNTYLFNKFTEHINCGWAAEKINKDSIEFSEKIQYYVIKNFGQPIEGFSAPIYLEAFPGLKEEDFDGVETAEGMYVYSNNKLNFKSSQNRYISSAGEVITAKGHETLFNNLRNKLGNSLSADEILNKITIVGPT